MKLRYLSLPIFILCLSSCGNDLDIIEDPKDIPIVYGLLSLSDTAQYIRVEKAFADEDSSALILAQDPANLYYESATVRILHENGQEYILKKVDGNLEGYQRQEGAFAQSPNILYKIPTDEISLVPGDNYILEIDRGDALPLVEASTTLVGPSEITTPSSSIGFAYIQPTRIRWRPGEGARTFDIYIQFNYRERITSSSAGFESKSIVWPMAKNIALTNESIQNYEKAGIDFYSFLAGQLEADPEIERRFDDITVILDSGGFEIRELMRVSNANLGITSSQDIPGYTNLSEGRGIFSSMYREEKTGIALKASSLDSLVNGIITRDLNFKS